MQVVPFLQTRLFPALGKRLLVYSTLPAGAMVVGELHWFIELFSHFFPYYLVGAALATLMLAAARCWRWTAAGLVCTAILSMAVWMPPYASTLDPAGGARLRVLQVNVLTTNRDHEALLRYVRDVSPDILSVQEVNQAWSTALADLKELYPFHEVQPREDNFGLALYSRVPMRNIETHWSGGVEVPAFTAIAEIKDREVALLVLHTLPPMGREYAASRIDS